jgi:hypothetical protein
MKNYIRVIPSLSINKMKKKVRILIAIIEVKQKKEK